METLEAFRDFFNDIKKKEMDSKDFGKRLILCFWGFSSNDYTNYRLYNRRIFDITKEFIPYYKRKKIRGNNKAVSVKILQNKYETLKVLNNNMIQTTSLRYLIRNGDMFRLDENLEPLEKTIELEAGDYVIKPFNLRWGKGIFFIQVSENIDITNCHEIQDSLNIYKNLLIEERLSNHIEINKLCSSSLNTLRIITVQLKSGEIDVIFACIRFSSTNKKIDNWSSGGFAANININTGIAYSAIKKNKNDLGSINNITEGFKVPFFDDAKKIAIKAHKLFKDMRSIGWDIAVTSQGPIIIEGNDDWDVILPQKLLQKGIKKFLCKI